MRAHDRCATRLAERHAVRAARTLEQLASPEVAAFLVRQPAPLAAGLLAAMSPGAAVAAVEAAAVTAAAAIVGELPRGTAGTVLRRLAPERRAAILVALPAAAREILERGLHYAEHTVGAAADVSAPALAAHLTAADARRVLRGVASAPYPYVYVTTDDHRLTGVVHVRELAFASPGTPLSEVMTTELNALPATAALATVAAHPGWQEFDALPVVEPSGVFLGALQHRHVRRARTSAPAGSLAAALFRLSELYWVGLSIWMPGGVGPVRASAAGGTTASGEGAS